MHAVVLLVWCFLGFADRLVPELDEGRFGMLSASCNSTESKPACCVRLVGAVSELDLIREERAAALSAAGQDRTEAALGVVDLDRTERRSLQAAVRQTEAPFRRRAHKN